MLPGKLILKSLWHYRKTNFAILLSAAVSAAVISGALILGESVEESLTSRVYDNTGSIRWVLSSGDRLLDESLAENIGAELGGAPAVAALRLSATASSEGGRRQAPQVRLLGVRSGFFGLSPSGREMLPEGGEAFINRRTAEMLEVQSGDTINISARKPGAVPSDAPFSTGDDIIRVRLRVGKVLDTEDFGNFSLRGGPETGPAVTVALEYLRERANLGGKVNLILLPEKAAIDTDKVNEALDEAWSFRDAGFQVRELPGKDLFEIRTPRVFIPPQAGRIISETFPGARMILTYFVNTISLGSRRTPYSVVASLSSGGPDTEPGNIIINSWLAEDIKAEPGDRVELEYYVIDSARRLKTETSGFTVSGVIPTEADKTLMPDFPGLYEFDDCREWRPGIPIDLDRIREKDEDYWYRYRGTPKAYINFEEARDIWGNPFGDLTSVRFEAAEKTRVFEKLDRALPASLFGIFFEDIKERRLRLAGESADFRQLFFSLNFFVTVSSLLLTGLFFGFYIKSRARSIGILISSGFTKGKIFKIFIAEGSILAAAGALAGTAGGFLYAGGFLHALSTLWDKALRAENLALYSSAGTLAAGFFMSFLFSAGAAGISLQKILKTEIAVLHSESSGERRRPSPPATGLIIALAVLLSGIITASFFFSERVQSVSFFIGGALALILCLFLTGALFYRIDAPGKPGSARLSAGFAGLRGVTRNPGRSLTVTALLAVGVFIITAASANRLSLPADPSERSSGTGGFSLFIRTAYPVAEDLNTTRGQRKLGLDPELYRDVYFLPMRLLEGEEASCLNPNRTDSPQVLGVGPLPPAEKGAFSFDGSGTVPETWALLDEGLEGGVIPAFADSVSVEWALETDENNRISIRNEEGQEKEFEIIRTLKNSVLQGYIIISERVFMDNFPSVGGYSVFLVELPDTDPERLREIKANLAQKLLIYGAEISDTGERLAEFNSVQNTYIAIFTALGGLGLLIGTIGLAALMLRNIIERRGEISLLRALGYPEKMILRTLMSEYLFLLVLGVCAGFLSAMIGVIPFIITTQRETSFGFLLAALLIIGAAGAVSVRFAASYALKGDPLEGLREE